MKAIFQTNADETSEPGISQGSKVYLLVLWFAFPILIPVFISVVSTPMFVARYAIAATIAFYLLASNGISSIKSKHATVALGFIILILSLINLNSYYNNIYKHQWREIVSEVENSAGYGDVLVIYPEHEETSAKYYKTRDDIKLIPMANRFPDFKNLGDKRVWVVMHADPLNRKRIKQGLSSAYDFELEKHFVKLDLFKLKQK